MKLGFKMDSKKASNLTSPFEIIAFMWLTFFPKTLQLETQKIK